MGLLNKFGLRWDALGIREKKKEDLAAHDKQNGMPMGIEKQRN